MFTALRTENVKADTSTITLDKHGGTGGTDTVDASLPDITPPTRTGYDFNGYYYRKPGVNLATSNRLGGNVMTLTTENYNDSSVPSGKAIKVNYTMDGIRGASGCFFIPTPYSHDIKKGDKVTLSVWMKYSRNVTTSAEKVGWDLLKSTTKVKYPDITTEWQKYVITGTAKKDPFDGTNGDGIHFYLGSDIKKGDILYLSSLKIEYGNTATDYSEPDSSNALVKVYDADGKSTGKTVPDGATLYAGWTPHTYTVKLDANGGTGSMNDLTFTYDKCYSLPQCTFTNGDYVFKGWNSKADGTGITYPLPGNLAAEWGIYTNIPNLATEEGATATLYAQWGLPDKVSVDEGYYHLRNCSNKYYYLTSPPDLQTASNGKDQIWHITKYGDGYRLTDENDGKCLTAKESSSEVGGLSMQDETDSDYQKWYFLNGSDGKIVMNAKNSYVLDSFNWGVSATNHPLQTYYVYDGGSDQKYVLEKATATVTCEDWFVDKDNNRKVKIASHTNTYDYGSTADGADFGTKNINSAGEQDKFNIGTTAYPYVYQSATTATVTAKGTTVYRYYYAWTNLNIYNSEGNEDYNTATVSLSIDGNAWIAGVKNETATGVNTIQPYGTTYYVKDITPIHSFEEFDYVSSGMTYDDTNKWYTYTPTEAGKVMEIKMKLNGKGGIFRIYANGGTGNSYKEITYGESTVISPMPSRTGYTLTGLYTASSGGTKVINADGSPANDGTYSKDGKWTLSGYLSVYAQWTPNTYSISYDLDGGIASNPTSYNAETEFTALKAPEKIGYTFAGWTGSNGNTPQKEVYVPETSDSIKWKLDIYKYAKATDTHVPSEDDIKGLSIYNSYDITDETGSHTNIDDYYIGKMYTWVYSKKEQTFTDTLHTDDSGALYVNGTLIATNSSTATTSITYTLNKGWNKIEVLYEERNGNDYAFFGKKLLTDGIVTKMSAVKSAENLSYAANWTANSGTVSYNANGGRLTSHSSNDGFTLKDNGVACLNGKEEHTVNLHTPSGSSGVTEIHYDDKIDFLDATNPTYLDIEKPGYHVNPVYNWNTKTDGSGTNYGAQDEYTAQSIIPSLASSSGGSVMLYVNWIPNTYTVKFDDNGGTGSMDDESMTYDTSKTLTANTFTKSDSAFTGWNTKPDGSGTFYSDASKVKNLTDKDGGTVTLYAQWAPLLPHTGSRNGLILTLGSVLGIAAILFVKSRKKCQ